MGGLSNALWLWLPVLIYKIIAAIFRTIWKFNLWILQTISGVPLYYCRPEYRLPAIFLGTLGLLFALSCLSIILTLGSVSNYNAENISQLFVFCIVGLGLLVLCRVLIRRGSI